MPRNMSFALTTNQVKKKEKTVTRRCGWWFLKPGDVVNAVEKSMGLKKGEKIARVATLATLTSTCTQHTCAKPNTIEHFGSWKLIVAYKLKP